MIDLMNSSEPELKCAACQTPIEEGMLCDICAKSTTYGQYAASRNQVKGLAGAVTETRAYLGSHYDFVSDSTIEEVLKRQWFTPSQAAAYIRNRVPFLTKG